MTWSGEACNKESDKIAHLVVPYLQGRSLDLGCGQRKVWPKCIGIDNGSVFNFSSAADFNADIADLSFLADATIDGIFSSHTIEDFERDKVPGVLSEWARLLKIGGYLCLYVPSANFYPKKGEPGANVAHKWDIYPGDLEKILREEVTCCGWELVESEERGQDDEYSIFVVVRKTESGWSENVWQRNPGGKKRCLIIRYGAIGDGVMTSSILPHLRDQGYHVTVNCKPSTQDVLLHDPHVDEWLLQDTDFVPNRELGPYWRQLAERYDRVINLCESIECGLLVHPGHLQHEYPDEVRRALYGDVNYLERTHQIAGVPLEPRQKFYPSVEERTWAVKLKHTNSRPAILIAVNGSSPHKIYPHMGVVLGWLLQHTPCSVWMTADAKNGRDLQNAAIASLDNAGIGHRDRLHPMAGEWSVRQALTFATVADCVFGPETGVLNAAAFEQNAKVVLLSHSSHTNLTRDWINTVALHPRDGDVACYPCHRLHHDWTFCHQDPETHAAKCAAAIPADVVFEVIRRVLRLEKIAA